MLQQTLLPGAPCAVPDAHALVGQQCMPGHMRNFMPQTGKVGWECCAHVGALRALDEKLRDAGHPARARPPSAAAGLAALRAAAQRERAPNGSWERSHATSDCEGAPLADRPLTWRTRHLEARWPCCLSSSAGTQGVRRPGAPAGVRRFAGARARRAVLAPEPAAHARCLGASSRPAGHRRSLAAPASARPACAYPYMVDLHCYR